MKPFPVAAEVTRRIPSRSCLPSRSCRGNEAVPSVSSCRREEADSITPRRHFLKRGALWLPTLFLPRLLRAQAYTLRDQAFIGKVGTRAPADVVTSGLLAWWRFDEASGTSVADSSGNGKTGTLSGGATWTTSNGSHGAVSFDGSNGKMAFSVPTVSTIWSIAMWIFPIASSDSYGALCLVPNSNGLYYAGATRKTNLYSAGDHFSTGAMTESAWHHVCVTVNDVTLITYIDGSQDSTTSVIAQNQTLGAMGDDSGSNTYKGRVSDARIYNRILTPAEVSLLYANP